MIQRKSENCEQKRRKHYLAVKGVLRDSLKIDALGNRKEGEGYTAYTHEKTYKQWQKPKSGLHIFHFFESKRSTVFLFP